MDIYAKGKSRRNDNRNILYPFFQQMSLILDDVYWQNILKEMSYGCAPKFFTIHPPQTIMFCKGAAQESLIISNDLETGLNQIIKFYHDYGNIYSPLDQKKSKIVQSSKPKKIITWQNSGKHIKQIMLICYFDKIKIKHNLTNEILLEGQRLLQYLLSNKLILANDIIIQDNYIVEINKFRYDETLNKFTFDGILTHSKSKSKFKSKSVAKNKTWNELLTRFENNERNYQNFAQHLTDKHGVVKYHEVYLDNDFSDEDHEDSSEDSSEDSTLENIDDEIDQQNDTNEETEDF
jgi:hypothetical protein